MVSMEPVEHLRLQDEIDLAIVGDARRQKLEGAVSHRVVARLRIVAEEAGIDGVPRPARAAHAGRPRAVAERARPTAAGVWDTSRRRRAGAPERSCAAAARRLAADA